MKKVRGNKRRLRSFKRHLAESMPSFPSEEMQGSGYWHLHMPCSGAWIDQSTSPTRMRKECVAAILEATKHLSDIRPKETKARVICSIAWPALWASQIIIFFGNEYFDHFFNRTRPEQTWLLKKEGWLTETFSLEIPSDFEERKYHETIKDEGYQFEDDLIFIGQFETPNSGSGNGKH